MIKHITKKVSVNESFRVWLRDNRRTGGLQLTLYASPVIDKGSKIAVYLEMDSNAVVLLCVVEWQVHRYSMITDCSCESWWSDTLESLELTAFDFDDEIDTLLQQSLPV